MSTEEDQLDCCALSDHNQHRRQRTLCAPPHLLTTLQLRASSDALWPGVAVGLLAFVVVHKGGNAEHL